MHKLLDIGLGLALGASLCAGGAQAQRGMRSGGVRVSSPIVVRSAPAQTVRMSSGRSAAITNSPFFSANSVSPFTFSTFGVPGFGFDFVHLAAVTRGLTPSNFRALFPVRPVRGSTPVFPVLFPLDPIISPILIVQQPPVVVAAPEATEEEAAPPPPRSAYRQAPAPPLEEAAPAPPPAPNQDTGEFVLVKRDGSLVFAVAFSARGDQLVYVTREGVRHSFLLSQLDADATRQMNEQRGTSIQLPE